jgi:hypothetical protein
MAIIFAAIFVPAIGDFIVKKPRIIFWTGVAVAAAGFTLPLAWMLISGDTSHDGKDDPMTWAMGYAMAIGLSLTILPRSIADQRRTRPALERASAETPPDELPAPTELVLSLIWVVPLAATIVATKVLIAAFPAIDAAYLLLGAGLPICAVFYGCLRWWAKRHAQGITKPEN